MKFWRGKRKRIYLDYAATTPLKPQVLAAMKPYLTEKFGNPSSVHAYGVEARQAVDGARSDIASLFKVQPQQIYFTASGTESNNLALFGVIKPYLNTGSVSVISIPGEHPSVGRVLNSMTEMGVEVKYAKIGKDGLLDIEHFKSLLTPSTKLVSIAYANSETGVVQDLREISRVIKSYNKDNDVDVLFHTDASQAPLWLSCELEKLGVDLMTLDAGKCYGPKGVGVLVNRSTTELSQYLFGGSQERSLRPGTENVAGIVGAAKALKLAVETREDRVERVKKIRDLAIEKLLEIKGVVLNGSQDNRLANNINISIPGLDSEYAVVVLDKNGIACSTRSACSGQDGSGSAVVMSMTNAKDRAQSTLRFSLGEQTKKKHIFFMLTVLNEYISKTRKFYEDLAQ